ncbi:hypothetical protein DA798_05550 [Lactobacillus sp. PFC-70]|nr:hypothetical protein DA798_05550 [Lactobacillus sp. PFC-70]
MKSNEYVGVEIESRFVELPICSYSEIQARKVVLHVLNDMGFKKNKSVVHEINFYFKNNDNSGSLKYSQIVDDSVGRLEYKKEVTFDTEKVTNLEMAKDLRIENVKAYLDKKNNVFNSIEDNRISQDTYVERLNQFRIHLKDVCNDKFLEIHASVDTVRNITDSNRKVPLLFVEFETSVPAPDVLKKLNNYSDIFQLKMSDGFQKTCLSKDEYFWKR